MPKTDAPFTPFSSNLDEGAALRGLQEALVGADDGELFFERKRSEAVFFDDGRIKDANYNASQGMGLRAVRGETAGYAHSTDMTEASLKRATETVRLAVGQGGGTMAPTPRRTNTNRYEALDPLTEAPFAVKIETRAMLGFRHRSAPRSPDPARGRLPVYRCPPAHPHERLRHRRA